MTTAAQLSENSHQGFESLKAALCLAEMEAKSNTAFGMPVSLRRNGTGSRSSSKERDAETGLDFFLARYYSGAQGRFLSPDEFKGGPDDALTGKDIIPPGPLPYADIANPQTLNKYSYVINNPLRYTDPDGHSEVEYDGETDTILIWTKGGEPLGRYPANNNVALRSIDGNYTNGPIQDGYYPVRSADAKGSGWLHAGEKSYGEKGIVHFEGMLGASGKTLSGGGLHSGQKDNTKHKTYGCVRTTDEATATLKKLAAYGPIKAERVNDFETPLFRI